MEVESRYRSVSRCCLMRDVFVREDMAGQFDIEAHEIGSPDIIKDLLVFGSSRKVVVPDKEGSTSL